jgi:hypothetical protein
MEGAALDLSKQKYPSGNQMFNVTVMALRNHSRLFSMKGEFLHLIEFTTNMLKQVIKNPGPLTLIEFMNDLEIQITEKKDIEAYTKLKDFKFDVGLVGVLRFQTIILKMFKIPLVKYNNYMSKGMFEAFAS